MKRVMIVFMCSKDLWDEIGESDHEIRVIYHAQRMPYAKLDEEEPPYVKLCHKRSGQGLVAKQRRSAREKCDSLKREKAG